MAVATEQETFESVGFITGISEGNFEDSFVAEVSNGDKLYGSKKKKDGTPAKVWPLIQKSLAEEKYYKWTGNLKQGDHGSFRKVTFGFEVEEGPGQQKNWTDPTTVKVETTGDVVAVKDVVPELTKRLENAQKASQAMQNGRKDDRNASFALSYAKDFVVGCLASNWGKDASVQTAVGDLTGIVLSVADDFRTWLDQQHQPQ